MKVNLGKYKKTNNTRTIKVNIEKFDTYSLDHTLALIIYPALLQLKATQHGVPGEFGDVGGADYDTQNSFDFYKETHDESFQKKIQEWETILDKMIWSFQQIVEDDYESLYHHGKPEFDWEPNDEIIYNPISNKMEKTFTLVDKNPNDHWIDMEGLKLHEQRIQEGLELFGKYYKHLWD